MSKTTKPLGLLISAVVSLPPVYEYIHVNEVFL